MLIHTLLVIHIAALGYWLGSELVINGTYRHVTWARDMPFPERDRLMDHVMNVDQHVRYALLLQLTLGFCLLFLLGYLPGGAVAAWLAALLGTAWLVLVEVTHRNRETSRGVRLAAFDRALRYLAMFGLVVLSSLMFAEHIELPSWLAWKLLAFVGVMACGVGIRLSLIRFFGVWARVRDEGSNEAHEALLRAGYRRATAILVLLWVFILLAVWLSVAKPA
jgi:hypothetical protein